MISTSHQGRATVTLPTDEEILIVREFDTPRHLVYRAWTTPALVRRWWAGRQGRVTEVEIDLRVGGRWRYQLVAHDGSAAAFHGEYREVVPNERIVHTEVFEARPDVRALTTVSFHEAEGRTTVSILVRHANKHDRDHHFTYLRQGLQEGLDLLEQTVVSLLTERR